MAHRGERRGWIPHELLPLGCTSRRSVGRPRAAPLPLPFKHGGARPAPAAAAAAAVAAAAAAPPPAKRPRKRRRFPPMPPSAFAPFPRPGPLVLSAQQMRDVHGIFVSLDPVQFGAVPPDIIWLPPRAAFELFGGPPRPRPMQAAVLLDGRAGGGPAHAVAVRRLDAPCGLPPTCLAGTTALLRGLRGCWLLGFRRLGDCELRVVVSSRDPRAAAAGAAA
ncbi:MAG: hypothetical protein J3K34DRAFT_405274, partial [Monoraphidium minutum]